MRLEFPLKISIAEAYESTIFIVRNQLPSVGYLYRSALLLNANSITTNLPIIVQHQRALSAHAQQLIPVALVVDYAVFVSTVSDVCKLNHQI